MTCEAFEKLIALDAGADLPPRETARLQAHLETCAPCRDLARSIGESQAGLRALTEVTLDEDALARWRRGVLARIEDQPQRRILAWRWAWAAAAAMALVALFAVPRMVRRPPSEVPVAHAVPPASPSPSRQPQPPQPPAPVAQALPPASASQTVAHHHPRRHRAPAPAAEPLLVKLETSDPNVVIYWIVEGEGN